MTEGSISLTLDDHVYPFKVEGANVRGRLVRLGPALNSILSAHAYPDPVARLLGDALVLTALLGSALKFAGIFSLQLKGEGPITLIAADYKSDGAGAGELRGYIQADTDQVRDGAPFRALVGEKASFALTIDPQGDMERYQGIVPAGETGLADSALSYFNQSEQIPTAVQLATARVMGQSEGWRAGGILIQHLPGPGLQIETPDADAWPRAEALLNTVKMDELTDPGLAPEDLIYRLYHEDGARVFPPQPLMQGCRCSRAKIEHTLGQFPRADIKDMVADSGLIEVTCEFCSARYDFDPAQITASDER